MQKWIVGPVQAMRDGTSGAHGMGFNITNEMHRPLLSLIYPSDAEAKSAKKLMEEAIKNASSVVVHRQ